MLTKLDIQIPKTNTQTYMASLNGKNDVTKTCVSKINIIYTPVYHYKLPVHVNGRKTKCPFYLPFFD